MLLKKKNTTFEVTHPTEIARLKRSGYVEVKPEVSPPADPGEQAQQIADQTVQPEKAATKKKGG